MKYSQAYDVLVVGGGHAGCEAALASARMGRSTLLLTMNIDRIGAMSCNPAIGGVGKGHIVREIDALGGQMGRVADATGIQFRRLNTRKGPAVRARRCQSDKARYAATMRAVLEQTPNLTIKQTEVINLRVDAQRVLGVTTRLGIEFDSAAVILTTGTFLAGQMHVGERQTPGGRAGDGSAQSLNDALLALGLSMGRLKTGTVPRLDRKSLRLDGLEVQVGEVPPQGFSFYGPPPPLPQRSCWLTETTPATHEIIRANLHRSAIFGGQIESKGPRYCPSIEDKIVRFPDKTGHRIFLEPEGLDTDEIYPNGISTSLPVDVQLDLVRSIPGCERAEITRPGYAVEYSYVDPRQLDHCLAVQQMKGLFLAGQINGTTGYEEAAGQGIVAGINAALLAGAKDGNNETFVLDRSEAYLGVMIDDLVTRGASEPYRMFTSRAEYRLSLREDNADARLTPRGRKLGLIQDEDWARFKHRWAAVESLRERLQNSPLTPSAATNRALTGLGYSPISVPCTVLDLLKRPDTDWAKLATLPSNPLAEYSAEAVELVVIQARYEGYIQRQQRQISRHHRLEGLRIPGQIAYENITALSTEVRQALTRVQPTSVGQASRIEGVTPAAISILLVHLKRMAA